MALTSLAGPAANLLASYVGCVIYYAIAAFAPYNAFVHYIFTVLSAIFRLSTRCWRSSILCRCRRLTAPNFAALLSDRARYKFYQYQNMLSMIGMLLIVSGALTVR